MILHLTVAPAVDEQQKQPLTDLLCQHVFAKMDIRDRSAVYPQICASTHITKTAAPWVTVWVVNASVITDTRALGAKALPIRVCILF